MKRLLFSISPHNSSLEERTQIMSVEMKLSPHFDFIIISEDENTMKYSKPEGLRIPYTIEALINHIKNNHYTQIYITGDGYRGSEIAMKLIYSQIINVEVFVVCDGTTKEEDFRFSIVELFNKGIQLVNSDEVK